MTKYIALSGTHGTGKSTLAYKLATLLKEQGFSVILVDELARECPFKINQGSSGDAQWWILAAQIKRELELKGKYDVVICDRTVIDTLAYAYATYNSVYENPFVDYAKETYNYIFYLDPEAFNFQVDDGIRDLDERFRLEVAQIMEAIYEDWEVIHTKVTDEAQILNLFSSVRRSPCLNVSQS